MIRTLLFVLCAPTVASADPWDVFQSYCLTPMLAAQSPITNEFTWIYEDDEIDVHQLELPPLSLTVNVFKDGTFSPVGCEMHFDDASQWDVLAQDFTAWRSNVLADQTFEMSEGGRSVVSTDQREPRIQVFAIGPDKVPRPYIAVEETYLES